MPKEYIEREAAINAIKRYGTINGSSLGYHSGAVDCAISTIEAFPVADVVEVVRCKDCKYAKELTQAEEQIYTNDCIMCTQIHPDGNRIAMFLNGFCSYGERKDGLK